MKYQIIYKKKGQNIEYTKYYRLKSVMLADYKKISKQEDTVFCRMIGA